MLNSTPFGYFKTHEKRPYAFLFLHRHVVDCLISQYQYHKNFYGESKSIQQWIEESNYGQSWREMAEYYAGCKLLSYTQLITDPVSAIQDIAFFPESEIKKAVSECSKEYLKSLLPNFISEPMDIEPNLRDKILEMNRRELKLLGYAS